VILDVISFLFPEHHMRRTRLFERLLMGRVVKRRPLIAGSETTLKDLDRLFGPVRAVVVPPWVPAAKSGSDERAAEEGILARLGIAGPYALYLGTIEPRKNVETVARAVASLRSKGSDLVLVVMGSPGWMSKRALAELDAAAADGSVIMTGYRPDAERDAVLASATCLVLPSVYEGFGLPILEAMRLGLPCVCSTAPAFDEVASDAVVHVDPHDVEGWATELERVARDSNLRASLIEAGLKRARKYSSEATARAFDEALAQLDGHEAPARS
jgi:glycosyltransferase involved in cell wall biosynthesis